ncbi:hypothetical protein OSTOST_08070, partial [Ostertagia ostertagi]
MRMLIVSWVDSAYRLHIYMDSDIGCKVFTFLAHLSDFNCVWMISWISCDRMVVLYRPGFRKWVCTKRFARNWMICTLLTSIVFYSWVFMFAGLEEYKDDLFCGLSSKAQVFG